MTKSNDDDIEIFDRAPFPSGRTILTRNMACAIAMDFANERMWRSGRTAWSIEDYYAACEAFAELMKLVQL